MFPVTRIVKINKREQEYMKGHITPQQGVWGDTLLQSEVGVTRTGISHAKLVVRAVSWHWNANIKTAKIFIVNSDLFADPPLYSLTKYFLRVQYRWTVPFIKPLDIIIIYTLILFYNTLKNVSSITL